MTIENLRTITSSYIPDSHSTIGTTTDKLVSLGVKFEIDRPILMSDKFPDTNAGVQIPIVNQMIGTSTSYIPNIRSLIVRSSLELANCLPSGLNLIARTQLV
jgi:hypothetical protein